MFIFAHVLRANGAMKFQKRDFRYVRDIMLVQLIAIFTSKNFPKLGFTNLELEEVAKISNLSKPLKNLCTENKMVCFQKIPMGGKYSYGILLKI